MEQTGLIRSSCGELQDRAVVTGRQAGKYIILQPGHHVEGQRRSALVHLRMP